MSAGRRLAGAIASVMLAVAGCERLPESVPDTRARPLPDSADMSADVIISPPIAGILEDTMVALGTPAITDTNAITPSSAELAELAAGMVVPVSGIRADQIADTFLEQRGSRIHHALDILAPRGTPVLSATDGRVLKLFTSVAGGLMIYAADPSERFVLLYSHLDGYAPGLADDAPLRAGQQIGTVGTTGNAPPGTPHLHFGIARTRDVRQWWTGTPVDPLPLLPRR